MKNEGKKFEDSFVKSIPDYVWWKRLNDNTAAWSGGQNTRFSSNNECDFVLHDDQTGTLYGLELKSTKEKSLTFWREDFEDKSKKRSFQIRKCQILGLKKWAENHIGVFGFIFNFRSDKNYTYFVTIEEFMEYTNSLNKKSININDIEQMNPIAIDSHLLRTNYRYDMDKFIRETRFRYGRRSKEENRE